MAIKKFLTVRRRKIFFMNNCICWRSSGVEQLICNQLVGGSNPSASFKGSLLVQKLLRCGEVPEWPKGADCKSVGSAFGGSNPPLTIYYKNSHQEKGIPPNYPLEKIGGCCIIYIVKGSRAGIAQLVERKPSKLDAAGSNPVSRSIRYAQVSIHKCITLC